MIYKKKNKKPQNSDEVDYWLSSTDIMASLTMIVLLVMMILLLYIVRIPDDDYVDLYEGDQYTKYEDPDAGGGEYGDHNGGNDEGRYWEDGEEEEERTENFDGGGGGGNYDNENEGTEEHDFPEEGGGEGKDKTAVQVMVVDEETDTTIKEKGILFELYSGSGSLQTLHTYYPDKKEYRQYETNQTGTFYLPEKIAVGSYELHELTVPNGYDIPENIEFTVLESLDWQEAYTVVVSLSPSKNKIVLHLRDSESKEALEGGEFEIVAAENIKTADGTTRYTKEQIVDRLTTDGEGYAESMELYLGKYKIRQTKIPEFYAGLEKEMDATVEKKKSSVETGENTIGLTKTSATITLYDELFKNIRLTNVAFRISCESAPTDSKTVRTNQDGEIYLTDLQKNTVYHIRQTTVPEGYNASEEVTFTVDSVGRIDGNAAADVEILNRTLRVSVEVLDRLMKSQVSGTNLTLFDSDGNVIESWNSTGIAKTISGMEQGNYYVLVNGNEKSRVDIVVNDTAEIQEYEALVFTGASIAILAGISLGGVILLVLLIFLLRKHIRKQKKKGVKRNG